MPRSESPDGQRSHVSRHRRDEQSEKPGSSSKYDEEKERRRQKRREERRREKENEYDNDRRERKRERERDKDRDRDRGYDKDDEREKEKRREKRRRQRERESRSPSPYETERRQRKEAKAAAKATARRETDLQQARAVAELSMYSAADNPFHDANLTERFVWNKKAEKEKKQGLSAADIARKDARRRIEAKEELERLNKRRADREVEMALREEEEARMKRAAEDAAMREWVSKEDDFQLEQARRRAGIRLREQRAKAIDFLAINLRFADVKTLGRHTAAIGALSSARKSEVEREEEEEGWGWADAGFEFEIDEPWKIFDNLNQEDCEELDQDIRMYLSLEKSPINIEFWEGMLQICEHHLDNFRDPDRAEGGRLFDREVDEAAGNVVSGLSLHRLIELENKTNAMLRSGQPVDGEFWDLVLKKIHVEKAVAKLNSIHEVVLKNRLEQFKKRQREDAAKHQAELADAMAKKAEDNFGGDMHAEGDLDQDIVNDADDEDDFIEDYDPEMSPKPADIRTMHLEERRLPIIDEEDYLREIFTARREVTSNSFIPRNNRSGPDEPTLAEPVTKKTVYRPSAADLEAERIYRAEAEIEKRDLGSDESEEEFGDLDEELQVAVPGSYDWSDRYRPRKPRFFNRVSTGFEWNTYNQTHYDSENPPPKVVQGYKFNIFYPDLIDKSKAPSYHIKRIPDDPETQIIIFTAGPPYEDIAFRIVRRPWEYGHRRGFRSTFDRGVLQLYFNFNRSFYRK